MWIQEAPSVPPVKAVFNTDAGSLLVQEFDRRKSHVYVAGHLAGVFVSDSYEGTVKEAKPHAIPLLRKKLTAALAALDKIKAAMEAENTKENP